MDETSVMSLKEIVSLYRDALCSVSDDEWADTVKELGFSPDNPDWPGWEGEIEEIRSEMDFLESLEAEKPVYITLSYEDDNEMNKVTGITATDGDGKILLDMDFVIPVDLSLSIFTQIQEQS